MRQKFYGIKWLSEYLGVSENKIYSWVKRKEIPFYRVGRLLKFRKEDIDSWMLERKVNPEG